ncbi:hypothetical protein PRIPAC_87514 [Pristionchus pacificus]|uniref:Uncharacterized protein n=1 Tax=Pristionchus pacificus TaxID=54126 RepID=A0A2A6CX77_PRIPA|nr:hypothetical protein PRIPAC_87514 [Pristionchus pacificus]|eukprot:PDM82647.1 hypothetical protein PRIPAC_37040 [Pristionchus pacificus]
MALKYDAKHDPQPLPTSPVDPTSRRLPCCLCGVLLFALMVYCGIFYYFFSSSSSYPITTYAPRAPIAPMAPAASASMEPPRPTGTAEQNCHPSNIPEAFFNDTGRFPEEELHFLPCPHFAEGEWLVLWQEEVAGLSQTDWIRHNVCMKCIAPLVEKYVMQLYDLTAPRQLKWLLRRLEIKHISNAQQNDCYLTYCRGEDKNNCRKHCYNWNRHYRAGNEYAKAGPDVPTCENKCNSQCEGDICGETCTKLCEIAFSYSDHIEFDEEIVKYLKTIHKKRPSLNTQKANLIFPHTQAQLRRLIGTCELRYCRMVDSPQCNGQCYGFRNRFLFSYVDQYLLMPVDYYVTSEEGDTGYCVQGCLAHGCIEENTAKYDYCVGVCEVVCRIKYNFDGIEEYHKEYRDEFKAVYDAWMKSQ